MRPSALDHVVVNVSDMERACDFYARVLGAEIVSFGAGRRAVQLGQQKLNLHDAVTKGDPVARSPSVGGADLCILTETPIAEVVRHLKREAVEIVTGPVERSGATGPILSVYIRDPDGSLIEIANRLDAPVPEAIQGKR